jgi:hypothetical protein
MPEIITRAIVARLRLSCNHAVQRSEGFTPWPAKAEVGDKYDCPKCPPKSTGGAPTRTVKEVQYAKAETPAPAPTPEPVVEDDGSYDPIIAQQQWKEFRDWRLAGQQGDRPDTTHLDRLNAAHAAGNPRSGSRGTKAPKRPRNADPVRLAANDAKRTKGKGGRHNSRRVTDVELLAYVTEAREAHPDSRSVDLRDYALWVDEVSVSFKRWDAAWDASNEHTDN